MTLWVVRVVEDLNKEAEALRLGTCIAGFDRVPDFRTLNDAVAIKNVLSKLFPAKNNGGLSAWASQILAFRDGVQVGDYVLMPSKESATLHVGVITGPYEHTVVNGKARHQRAAKWHGQMRKDATRDAQGSVGAFLSVFRVDKPLLTESVREIINAKAKL